MPSRRSNDGFTFLEIISVIAIIAFLVVIATPSWIGFTQRLHTRYVADRVEWHLRGMVSEAVHRKEYTRIVFCTTKDTLYVSNPYARGSSPSQFSSYADTYARISAPYNYLSGDTPKNAECHILQFGAFPGDGSTLHSICFYNSASATRATHRIGVKSLLGAIGKMDVKECNR